MGKTVNEQKALVYLSINGENKLIGTASNIQFVGLPSLDFLPRCRCQLFPEKFSYSWTAKVGNITFHSKKKAVNLVKRLAARAIIYASIHQ